MAAAAAALRRSSAGKGGSRKALRRISRPRTRDSSGCIRSVVRANTVGPLQSCRVVLRILYQSRLALHTKSKARVPTLLKEGSGIEFFPMPRGEVSGNVENTRLRTSPRVISLSLDHAALLKEGRNPPDTGLYVQSH